jgi:hypothetical protein
VVAGEFTEVESGKRSDRPALPAAQSKAAPNWWLMRMQVVALGTGGLRASVFQGMQRRGIPS